MCGIAGLWDRNQATDRLEATRRMAQALAHRGPDGEGVAFVSADRTTVFGHRRLAIIDLSDAGLEPMIDQASQTAIVYNGETYNFRELRRELETAGHRFCSGTDTEVVLRGYLQWGTDVFQRLNGIFALAIYDPVRSRLVLARDGLGVKPLYLYEGNDRLAFASEVRALLASGLVPATLDLDGLRSYLAFGSVQEPMTLVKNVASVPPGACIQYEQGRRTTTRFYDLPADDGERAIEVGAVRQALIECVGSQLVSDVPLGAFLSGGIDSSAIAIAMSKAGATDVRTFNVCFRGAPDERQFAKAAARAAGATHTDVELGEEEFLHNLDAALASYDQPSVDGVNTWFVSRAAHDAGLTVALSGVGGDELFVGYDRFARQRMALRAGSAAAWLPAGLRLPLGRWAERHGARDGVRKMGTLLASSLSGYFTSRRLFGPAGVEQLIAPALRAGYDETWAKARMASLDAETAGLDPINRASRLELRTYMLSTLLRDADQMAMAHALEVRVPLIDTRLIDLILPLPAPLKVSARVPKRLLVEPLPELPNECVFRPKRGFTLPFHQWLASARGRDASAARLAQAADAVQILDRSAAAAVFGDFYRGRTSWSRPWSVFVLADWLSRHRLTH